MFIPEKKYREIVQLIPILCIDALIINNKNECLLLKRLNEPLKGIYWVPGGRVLHLEKTEDALIRIMKKELNIDIHKFKREIYGVYEDFFNSNSFKNKTNYHTVSVVYKIFIGNEKIDVILDSQSSKYKFSKEIPTRFKNLTQTI
jgi:colanic acid biosynthesis protein WcaH